MTNHYLIIKGHVNRKPVKLTYIDSEPINIKRHGFLLRLEGPSKQRPE